MAWCGVTRPALAMHLSLLRACADRVATWLLLNKACRVLHPAQQ